jgi:hypothetical protein
MDSIGTTQFLPKRRLISHTKEYGQAVNNPNSKRKITSYKSKKSLHLLCTFCCCFPFILQGTISVSQIQKYIIACAILHSHLTTVNWGL